MVPEGMQLGDTETIILSIVIVLLLVGLLVLRSQSNRRKF